MPDVTFAVFPPHCAREKQRAIDCYYLELAVSSVWFNLWNNLPKSMNCFIESGEGENLENLSTCFGMLNLEVFFSNIWANFILNPKSKSRWTWNDFLAMSSARSLARELTPFMGGKANLRLASPHNHYNVNNSKAVVLCKVIRSFLAIEMKAEFRVCSPASVLFTPPSVTSPHSWAAPSAVSFSPNVFVQFDIAFLHWPAFGR